MKASNKQGSFKATKNQASAAQKAAAQKKIAALRKASASSRKGKARRTFGSAPGSYQDTILSANKRLEDINKALTQEKLKPKEREALQQERAETQKLVTSLLKGERKNIDKGYWQEKRRMKSVQATISNIARGLTGETATVGGSIAGSKIAANQGSTTSSLVNGPIAEEGKTSGRDEERTKGDYEFVNDLGGFN